MTTETKKTENKITLSTPVGELFWVKVRGAGQAPMTAGDKNVFCATLVLPKEDKQTQEFLKQLSDLRSVVTKKKLKDYSLLGSEILMGLAPCSEDGKRKYSPSEDEEAIRYTYADCAHLKLYAKTQTVHAVTGSPIVIPVKDSQNNPLPDALAASIGNGSRGRLRVTLISGAYEGKAYIGVYLNAIQIVDFKESSAGGADFEVIEDGYSVTEAASEDSDNFAIYQQQ